MLIKRPTREEMKSVLDRLHMSTSVKNIDSYLPLIDSMLQAYDVLDSIKEPVNKMMYKRENIYYPTAEQNPYNGWYVKATIRGAEHGKLVGKTLAIKDNTCVAGIPMMIGSSTLEHYVPKVDATIVTRILDAGGTIVGKAHCEAFCMSGASHTNASGPVLNLHNTEYSSGGSSSGSALLVAGGFVDMATGGDQGGSVRIPSAWCGVYGMKPTYGLVPYSGIMPIDRTIDHAGPITKSVSDNALLLEVLAGYDGLDTRQQSIKIFPYTDALGKSITGMKIGVVTEGFAQPNAESDVNEKVMAAAEQFVKLGAHIEFVSIPQHLQAAAIWSVIAIEGLYAGMMQADGFISNTKDVYILDLMQAHHKWRKRADELSEPLKMALFVADIVRQQQHGLTYAKAQNLVRPLSNYYNQALNKFDLLLMPTTPGKPTKIPKKSTPFIENVMGALNMVGNTCPFDLTGHPAMSMPCGKVGELPIGLMLIAKHFDESTIYQAAYAFEQNIAFP